MREIESRRYPDPAVRVLDPRFDALRIRSASVECLFQGARWAEGPVWFGDGRYLLWSDIPNNRLLRWDEQSGAVGVFRQPSNNANGNTRDRAGRLVTCEHLTRRVTRTEYDGSITVLAERFEGRRLNSPNDVIVKSDGSIWFSDPDFGIQSFYEGEKQEPELPERVYRIDPHTRELEAVVDGVPGPNGLAFSPDESILYVVESKGRPRTIRAYDVASDGKSVRNERVLIDAGEGTPDGFRVDAHGNLWCGWGMGADELDGVRVFTPEGDAIGHIALPERCANVCFGGRHRNRLFMAASHGLYSLYVNAQGVAGG
ncbi:MULTISPECIES: SMP-30/gluconolactonase/LRE family protein [Burkholderia]|uniref:Gluconolactonase n=1 Tax=Burkholderia savannae TaxID=1637837 RepID=A0ABR5T7P4_9BURK|nr:MULTISPECIES: SMP-30/gluconolactonase/LRE family protein [Burkholderia]AOJ73286.1 gluconolactonase [Burkholderia savannae]AOK51009.1 gluconolactonase [Burkholderia sp. MSMB617WGS]KGS02709.1 strictosidine synthase family protein [Burkholderia sp. ABCPW 111]KVG45176.1 gluconolactonase [Burkholderia sp. MSMB0265]KVG90136.1 gluconolactonase [Burkholderia sp. MSMB2040]